MIDWTKNSDLEIIEALASWEDMIDSEEALSKRFDDDMGEFIKPLFEDNDEVAISDEFSNWADRLCQEGDIHVDQYESYEYVGEYQC